LRWHSPEDAETLIKNADTAMYHTKESGRNNFQFFKADMNLKAVERQSLEGSLRCALERKEFLLHYQPKANLDTGEITGVEALIRWQQILIVVLTFVRVLIPAKRSNCFRRCGADDISWRTDPLSTVN
jgi:predicted signal transduction protein with EAL and GGDEF domain